MRKAAHCMVRTFTSGLAMITCREQVIQTLTTNLKQHFLSVLIVSWLDEMLNYFLGLLTILIVYIVSVINPKRND